MTSGELGAELYSAPGSAQPDWKGWSTTPAQQIPAGIIVTMDVLEMMSQITSPGVLRVDFSCIDLPRSSDSAQAEAAHI